MIAKVEWSGKRAGRERRTGGDVSLSVVRRHQLKLRRIGGIVLACTIPVLACCQSGTPPKALPVTASLSDYELIGSVSRVINEARLQWNDERKRFAVIDDAIEIWEFNREGFLTRIGRAYRDQQQQLMVTGADIYRLDDRNRLQKFIVESKGRVGFEVSYVYRIEGSAIDILPVNPKAYDGWMRHYRKYRQVFQEGRVEIWTDGSEGDAPAKRGEFVTIQNGKVVAGERFGTQLQYSEGRLAAEVYPPDWTRKEDRYEYEGAAIWPSRHTVTYRDGTVTVDEMEYTFDSHGNWTKRNTYRVNPGGERQLIGIAERKVDYY